MWELNKKEAEYITAKYREDFPLLDRTMDEARFLISELGVTAREATYWDKQGILPELKGKGQRRKYDLVQAIWIKLIKQMRLMNVGVQTIKGVKKQLFVKVGLKELFEDENERAKILKHAASDGNLKEYEQLIDSVLSNETPVEKNFSLFKYAILNAILLRYPLSLLVNQQGEIVYHSQWILSEMDGKYKKALKKDNKEIIEAHEAYLEFLNGSHISVSISKAYQDLISDWHAKPFFKDLSLISESEMEVLHALKKPGVKSINVRMTDGEPTMIEVKSERKVNLSHRFMDVISKGRFQEIVIKTRDGDIKYFENTELIKLKAPKASGK